ncbi:MAG TPA: DNA recombination protein RmuC [Saprospiraceae bacterium]|nr:DNA recombination protein RmuC [Saprospiraceae bacterium]
MELTPILIGIAIGAIVGYILFTLLSKGKNISRSDYDAINVKLNEVSSNLRIAEERLKNQSDIATSHQQRADAKSNELTTLLSQTATLEATLKNYAERYKELQHAFEEQKSESKTHQSQLNAVNQKLAEYIANNSALLEKLNTQKEDLISTQKMAQLQFEKLANQIFEEKSGKFTESNKNNIEALLKPLNENIETFKKKVDETYDKESKERFSLGEKVKDLIENTNKVSQEANNLANALKGQTKKQGDWGETILESILEKSGLVKDREYFLQENYKNENEDNVRPDITIKLPDQRIIIVDSKVSLNAYSRYSETESKEEYAIHLQNHLKAIYNHIDQLQSKKYEQREGSLDFVIMFFPIEPAYMLAIQSDPDLWTYAYTNRILLISPTNLIAVLKIVADLWKREQQSKNAIEIARQGGRLYEKFVGFLESIESVGRHITRSQDFYNQAMGQLKDGKGNLIDQAEKLKILGVKSAKKIPSRLLQIEPEEDETGIVPENPETEEGQNSSE